MLKEVRTAALEAKKKEASEEKKVTEEKKKTEDKPRLSSSAVNELEKEFMTDEELEESSEEATDGTETSVVPDTEEGSTEDKTIYEAERSTDEVVKMEL